MEAGLRSYDRSMPEEVNRTLTDQLSELLFTTEQSLMVVNWFWGFGKHVVASRPGR